MSVAPRRIVASRGVLLSFSLGLAAAGCAAPHEPVAQTPPAKPKAAEVAKRPTDRATTNPGAATADDDGSRALVDSVNDNVDRVSRLLARRAQDQQLADDLHEQRAATAAPEKSSAKSPEDGARLVASKQKATPAADDDSAAIERLAAEIRDLKARAAARDGKPAVAAADVARDVPAGAIATPMALEMRRNGTPVAASSTDPLAALDAQFANKVSADPKSLDAQLGLQLVRFLKNDPVPSENDLSSLPGEDRELLSSVCDALSNFRSVIRASPNPMTSEKARPFVEMGERVRAQSDLTISNATLCTAVRKFGDYDPFGSMRFAAGQATDVVLYCELDGLQSRLNDKQQWDTKLSLGVKLFNEGGLELWSSPAIECTDVSRRRRRDFYVAQKLTLPPTLAPGRYLLKATVRDLLGSRVSESTLQVDLFAK